MSEQPPNKQENKQKVPSLSDFPKEVQDVVYDILANGAIRMSEESQVNNKEDKP